VYLFRIGAQLNPRPIFFFRLILIYSYLKYIYLHLILARREMVSNNRNHNHCNYNQARHMADPVKFSEANFLFHINRNSGDFVFILI